MILMTTVALVAVVILSLSLSRGCARRGFSYDVYQVVGGWGYDVKYEGQVKIHQPFIPAVSGSKPFPNKRTAKQTARAVIDQILETGSPTLDVETVNKILKDE